MNIFLRFPEGKGKALTLSYDDGVEQDIRLIEIMKKHGLKGTFNINSGLYAERGIIRPYGIIHNRMTKKQAIELYKSNDMEVAVHGLTHPFLEQLPQSRCVFEIMQDRTNLETDFETIIRGMAYPYGTYNDSIVECLKQCGIAYSRTVKSTEDFKLPTDWLRLPATCHHNNPRLMELAHKFAEHEVTQNPQMFYLWGHSYEFESDDNWSVIETFAEYIGNREDIWYATNIEIYDYVKAYEQLLVSTDGRILHNPTSTEIYFMFDCKEYCIKPNETLKL